MRKTRFASLAASAALASATILGGAGIASAAETDTVVGNDAKVTATATDNCEVTFEFVGDTSIDRLNSVNWVVDYRVDGGDPTIENEDPALSVYNPVVASNQKSVDALNNHEDYDYDVGLLKKTVNLNDVVDANEDGEHAVSFKFYRGSADWNDVQI